MWNGTGVAGITGHTGSDNTNKDDGRLIFNTASAGSATERMRIDELWECWYWNDQPV